MTGLALCALAFGLTYWAGKKALGLGIVALLAFGYFYGIVRANILATATYFLFDMAVLGLYLSQRWKESGNANRSGALGMWLLLLALWPAVLVFVPFQPVLVSLVGLRGVIFFLPMAWFGKRLKSQDIYYISLGFAALNLAAFFFAGAEYLQGVPRYYPVNAVTITIYASSDVAGGFYRIPATFVNAHNFGGVMVASIPYLLGAWQESRHRLVRVFMLCGLAAALLGVLMSATRLNFIIGSALVLLAIWKGHMTPARRALFVALMVVIGLVALRNERFQRFKSLSDTDYVQERISGSINRGFFEILMDYPLGNGLGGGGTSIPYFLAGQVHNPVATENEYARILCEQGPIGLLLWIGFIFWFLSRYSVAFAKVPWQSSRRMIWLLSVIGLITSVMGNGMLTAIPQTAILLLGIGFSASPMLPDSVPIRRLRMQAATPTRGRYSPVPSY